jgi:SAM-dependent methyltransferase
MTPFYRAFEDKHRGSHDVIKERLRVYLPFIEQLKSLYQDCLALDIGCGRGEWLETLQENGFQAIGVDLDEGMLEACKARNLPAEKAEALSYLETMPSESLVLLTGFHIVEHIPFDDLKKLVIEAHRVLKPGGLLIFETPNAENLIVGTQNFYLDPTHERPIPYMLLEFLMEYSGFSRSKLLRLQENPDLDNHKQLVLMNVLGGVSPDYAVVAQKNANDLDVSAFDLAFKADYGLGLDELARRYDSMLLERHSEMKVTLELLAGKEIFFSERMGSLENSVEKFTRDIELATAKMEHEFQKLLTAHQYLAVQFEQSQKNIFCKRSISLRLLGSAVKSAIFSSLQVLKQGGRDMLKVVINKILKTPIIRNKFKVYLQRFPKLYLRLKNIAIIKTAVPAAVHNYGAKAKSDSDHSKKHGSSAPEHLTVNAKKIYVKLNSSDKQRDFK